MTSKIIFPPLPQPASHTDVVRHFIKHRRAELHEELEWFAGQCTFAQALDEAAHARDKRGKRLHHQRRLLMHVIPQSHLLIQARAQQLGRSQSFDDLLSQIEQILSVVNHAGDLYFYDTALRIGTYLGLHPTCVFLQTGARTGAKKLSLGHKTRSLPLSAFPEPFHALAPFEMENVLCIYKQVLLP
jgi:hypothetical protein